MSQDAVTYFNQAQMMLLDLHGSLLRSLLARQSMEEARLDNEETLRLFENVEFQGEIEDVRSMGLDRVRLKLQGNIRAIDTYELLLGVIAGAMLQICKQTLSVAHGKQANGPKGKSVSSSCVRDLIWHGRNQSMHYEDTRPNSTWVEEFRTLNTENPGKFEMARPYRSLALDVLDLLGWTTNYGKLDSDMRGLIASGPGI
ncbi:hypothetical protein YA0637_22110 [Pseudomonas syringae]|uniref:hypothetical protein n=1 Tax=Pseudomonas syringae TaxID=317 RepID=UPI0018E5B3E1|nr:hypothetical protein [Pseudomonas syringae]MBI6674239.1 hypothetical protein [Pseudomonas syringae]UOF21354.1 hypothetical protein N023_07560 [Pseudomonas syringae CC440]UZA78933.1 hypothetical protein EZZ79_07915 [Pseudomonas syringae]